MPVIYKLLTKMLANHIKGFLHDGLHPVQYGFVPRRQINDNLAHACIAIEYAKYTKQDVLILQIDIEKAFDSRGSIVCSACFVSTLKNPLWMRIPDVHLHYPHDK